MQKESLAELNKDPSYGIYTFAEAFEELLSKRSSVMKRYIESWKLIACDHLNE